VKARNDMNESAVNDAAPHLFDEVIDRKQLWLPSWYAPSAQGAVIAGKDILCATGCIPGSRRPYDWYPGLNPGVFWRVAHDSQYRLWVRETEKFWAIERSLGHTIKSFALCSSLAGVEMLIWTRTCEAAMRLAEYCDPLPRPPVAGGWTETNEFI